MTYTINIHSKVNVWKTNNDLLLYTTIQKEIEVNEILLNCVSLILKEEIEADAVLKNDNSANKVREK